MLSQATIKYPVEASGIGLHTNEPVNIKLKPAPENTGVVFRRVDLDPVVELPVRPTQVKETKLCTTLVVGEHKVKTIEHLMSALFGMGVDNIYIDIDAPEVPILDGSASEFIFLLQTAGIRHQTQPKTFIRIIKPIDVHGANGGWARLEPYEGFKLTFSVKFDHPAFIDKHNTFTVDFSHTSFLTQISRARTFGFQKDMADLWKNNMALGGSVNNAIIMGSDGPLNQNGLRTEGEPVKHKVLDAVGDLYVFNRYIIGAYVAHKSGHALNNSLLHALIAQPDCWETAEFQSKGDIPINFIQSKVA